MTDDEDPAADAATDPDAQDTEEDHGSEQVVEEATWQEAQAHFAERQNETRELAVDLGGAASV